MEFSSLTLTCTKIIDITCKHSITQHTVEWEADDDGVTNDGAGVFPGCISVLLMSVE